MPDTIDLTGRVAAITGAGNGLGRAYALELARRGASVVVNDLGGSPRGVGADPQVSQTVAEEVKAAGGVAVAHFGDAASESAMQAMVDLAVSEYGRIDILINNAGFAGPAAIDPAADWERIVAVNLYGAVHTIRAAWPHMVSQNFGRIINTSSSSFFGTPNAGAYAAVKGALIGLAKVMTTTYTDHDIKVNTLMPIAGTRLFGLYGASSGSYADWVIRNFSAEQVAAFVPVLCRADLDFSGEVFTVGGGRAARVLLQTSDGWWEKAPTAESFLDHMSEVMAGSGASTPPSGAGDLSRYTKWFDDKGPFAAS